MQDSTADRRCFAPQRIDASAVSAACTRDTLAQLGARQSSHHDIKHGLLDLRSSKMQMRFLPGFRACDEQSRPTRTYSHAPYHKQVV